MVLTVFQISFNNVKSIKSYLYVFLISLLSNYCFSQNKFITGGHNYSAALCEDGSIFVWGQNNLGQLGKNEPSKIPIHLNEPLLPKIKMLSAGSGFHVIAAGIDGYIYTWGGNNAGQLGHGNVSGNEAGKVLGVGGVGFLTNPVSISTSHVNSYAVIQTGEVVAWGDNSHGQLGNSDPQMLSSKAPVYVLDKDGELLKNMVRVQSLDYGGVALAEDSTVWTWGGNSNMELGRKLDPSERDSYYAAQVVKKDGTLLKVIEISAGSSHVLALDKKGNVWSWGGDWGPGQLGHSIGYDTNVFPDKVAGGQTGTKYLENVVSISAGQAHSVALIQTGEVVSWGSNTAFGAGPTGMEQRNNTGLLGIGLGPLKINNLLGIQSYGVEVPQYVLMEEDKKLTAAKAISTGDSWTFITTYDDKIYGTGYNEGGFLGTGDTINRGYPTIINFPPICTIPEPCPSANLKMDTLMNGDTTIILYAGSKGNTYQFFWYRDGALLERETGKSGEHYIISEPGIYKVLINKIDVNTEYSCSPSSDSIVVSLGNILSNENFDLTKNITINQNNKDNLLITIKNIDLNNASLEMYNLNGHLAMRSNISSDLININFSFIPGVYILKIITISGTYIKKLQLE